MGTILVTGASTGIGEACALRLDALGHVVFAGVRREADGDRLRERSSDRLRPLLLDVTDQSQVDAAARQVGAERSDLLGLVNNAGVARGGPLELLPLEEWREQLEVNVIGQVAVTRALLPALRAARGRIVFMGSIGGRSATALMGPYNASKFAIEGIGASLRAELRPHGVHVAVVEPGAVKTAIWGKARETADRLEAELPEEGRRLYGEQVAAIRKGIELADRHGSEPAAVVAAVEHALLSPRPRARYVVGLDARAQSAMLRLLPDGAKDAVMRRITGL